MIGKFKLDCPVIGRNQIQSLGFFEIFYHFGTSISEHLQRNLSQKRIQKDFFETYIPAVFFARPLMSHARTWEKILKDRYSIAPVVIQSIENGTVQYREGDDPRSG